VPASVIGPVKGPRSARTSSNRRVAGRKRPEPVSAARSSCGLPLEPARGCGVSLRRGFAMPTGYRLLRPAPKLSLVRISMWCRTRVRPPSLPRPTSSSPSGVTIFATRPDYLLATKIEAFNGRGHEDFLGSRDFGDMISLVDGRQEIVGEIQRSEPDLRAYLASELGRLRVHPRFREGISGALRADFASQARAEAVVLPRLEQIVS
jgi:hypothetical protein